MGYTELREQADYRYYDMNSLEGAAIRFIRHSCEGLRFDMTKADESQTGVYTGSGLKQNQIPYNMQMDIDRLCLENAIALFLKSGKKEDAFNVYFCYLEMFVGKYERTRRMIELLSEFEANGSGLLMKHRDHYSHSVYVFILGLAIFETNEGYRQKYKEYYQQYIKFGNDNEMACHYLEYWGLASLFHDIGYPFELPFEQVCSYFEVDGDKRKNRPYMAYHGLDSYIAIDDVAKKAIENGALYPEQEFNTINEVLAIALSERLEKVYPLATREQMCKDLEQKPTQPDKYNHYMDHAYFSAVVLFKKLFGANGCGFTEVKKEHLDSLTAILMHNSLYKFCIANYKKTGNKPFKPEIHPLAYMLMLCDELQCWDRIAYGRNSKKELHPMGCTFNLSDNIVRATYLFDEKGLNKINAFKDRYIEWLKRPTSVEPSTDDKQAHDKWEDSIPKLKAYSSMYLLDMDAVSVLSDIKCIIDTSEIGLEISSGIVENNTFKKSGYLSNSNFINLYNFAVILNGRWDCIYSDEWKRARNAGTEEQFFEAHLDEFEVKFETLSLEYKLYNINQAKAFDRYLDAIDCFYTDKIVDFEILEEFSEQELSIIGPMEHHRWLQEHYDMGWSYGEKDDVKDKREVLRQHWDMIPGDPLSQGEVAATLAKANYERIGKAEQDKDKEPMECMVEMLKMFDGLRIYRLH